MRLLWILCARPRDPSNDERFYTVNRVLPSFVFFPALMPSLYQIGCFLIKAMHHSSYPVNILYLNLIHKVFTIKSIFLYAAAMAAILILLQWMQFNFLVIDHATEIYSTGIAVIFTFLGIWLARKLTRPKKEIILETVVVEKEVTVYKPAHEPFLRDREMISQLGISQREMEVLALIAGGRTNQEVADALFGSLNTIKTHTSRLFEKLDVKRRTAAIEKAGRLNIIP